MQYFHERNILFHLFINNFHLNPVLQIFFAQRDWRFCLIYFIINDLEHIDTSEPLIPGNFGNLLPAGFRFH